MSTQHTIIADTSVQALKDAIEQKAREIQEISHLLYNHGYKTLMVCAIQRDKPGDEKKIESQRMHFCTHANSAGIICALDSFLADVGIHV